MALDHTFTLELWRNYGRLEVSVVIGQHAHLRTRQSGFDERSDFAGVHDGVRHFRNEDESARILDEWACEWASRSFDEPANAMRRVIMPA